MLAVLIRTINNDTRLLMSVWLIYYLVNIQLLLSML